MIRFIEGTSVEPKRDQDCAIAEFTQGVMTVNEIEPQRQVADLVGELVRALGASNHRKLSATVYVNLAVGLLTVLTVVFYGGATWQRLNDHEARLNASQASVAIISQLSAQVASLQSEISYMRARQDKLIDAVR